MEKFEIKHTPGPWAIYSPEKNYYYPGIESYNILGRKTIIVFGTEGEDSGVKGSNREQIMANAHLIAAAPLLLSALIKAVEKDDQIEEGYNAVGYGAKYVRPDWYNEALSAIAAAGVTVKTDGI